MAIILPVDPFTKNNPIKQNTSFEITSVMGNSSRGKSTGVDLRWHTVDELKSLSQEQKGELQS